MKLRTLCICVLLFTVNHLNARDTSSCDSFFRTIDLPVFELSATANINGSYTFRKKIISDVGGKGRLKLIYLRDIRSNEIVDTSRVKIENKDFNLPKNKELDFFVNIIGLTLPGKYYGLIEVNGPQCKSEFAIKLEMYNEKKIMLLSQSQKVDLDLAHEFGSAILPKEYSNYELTVLVKNENNYAIELDTFRNYIADQNQQRSYSSLAIDSSKSEIVIPADGLGAISFNINSVEDIKAQSYSGNVELRFKHFEKPLVCNWTINMRESVFWAIIAILLGILTSGVLVFLTNYRPKYDLLKILFTIDQRLEDLRDRPGVDPRMRLKTDALIYKIRRNAHSKEISDEVKKFGRIGFLLIDTLKAEEALIQDDPNNKEKIEEKVDEIILFCKADDYQGALNAYNNLLAHSKNKKIVLRHVTMERVNGKRRCAN